jgi:hypothetical protein
MKTRKKTFYRSTQMLAMAALMSTAVAPYVVNADTIATATLPKADEVVTAGAPFTFETGDETINSYMKAYINQANIVKINGALYADITLTGHTYSFTKIKLNDEKGNDVEYSSNGLEKNEQIRVIRVPLNDDMTSVPVYMGGDHGTYTFVYNFAPAKENLLTNISQLVSSAQQLKLELTSEPTYYAMAIGNYITDAYAKAANGKFDITLKLKEDSLDAFSVTQGEKTIAKWNGNGTVTFTVDTLDQVGLSMTATSERGTSTMNAKVAKVILTGETAKEVIGNNTASNEIPAATDVKGKLLNYTFVTDTTGFSEQAAAFLKTYFQEHFFSNAKLVTIDNKQYVDLGLIYKSFGFEPIEYAAADGSLAEAKVIQTNGAKDETFQGTVRVPVTASVDGSINVTIKATGSQPGSEAKTAYSYNFTFKPATMAFTDLTGSYAEFTEDVKALYEAGITTGKSQTSYEPAQSVKRYEFAVMIARALNLQPTNKTSFTDVQGQWYESAVQALYEANIISGKTSTSFDPNAQITRQQAAKILVGMLEYLGYNPTATIEDLNFTDEKEIADYAKLPIAELQKQGIMEGSQGIVNPSSTLKRGQMAKLLKRSLDKVNYFK